MKKSDCYIRDSKLRSLEGEVLFSETKLQNQASSDFITELTIHPDKSSDVNILLRGTHLIKSGSTIRVHYERNSNVIWAKAYEIIEHFDNVLYRNCLERGYEFRDSEKTD